MKGSKYRWVQYWMVAAGILLIACWASVARSPLLFQPPKATSDGPIYENIAFHLWQGRGFYLDWSNPEWRAIYQRASNLDTYQTYLNAEPQQMPHTGRPPLLPLQIALTYCLVGRNELAFAITRLFAATCIALACSLSVLNALIIFRRLRSPESPSSWACAVGCMAAIAIAASNRTLLSYANDFLTEPMALLATQSLVTLLIWNNGIYEKQQELSTFLTKAWLRISIAIALATMVYSRSLFVFWLPPVAAMLFITLKGTYSSRIRTVLITIVITFVLLLPWWTRNCYVLQRWMPLGTQGPITLLGGYCDEAVLQGGDWQHGPEQRLRASLGTDPTFQALPDDVARELRVADESRILVRKWMNEHWDMLPTLFVKRIVTHWNPYTGPSLVWKILAIIGAWKLIRNAPRDAVVLVGLPLMNTMLIGMLYSTGGRFLVPLYGILFTLAAIGVTTLTESLLPKKWLQQQTA